MGRGPSPPSLASAWPAWFPPSPSPPCRHGSTCLPDDYPLYTPTEPMVHVMKTKQYALFHVPSSISPPRLSILITIQTNTQYKVIICQVLSTVYIHHTPPEAEEGRHTNPSSYTIKTLTCPFLSVLWTQLSIFKMPLFIHFISLSSG
jgi:hypothetical protein